MHKVVIKGNYYGRTRTLPDLNDYLHECARHPQMGAKTVSYTHLTLPTT